jgi:hypothetical protein
MKRTRTVSAALVRALIVAVPRPNQDSEWTSSIWCAP